MQAEKTDPLVVVIWTLCLICIVGLIVGYIVIKP
jgi:hypothetical protein